MEEEVLAPHEELEIESPDESTEVEEVEEETAESRSVVNLDDFDSTLYFLDESEMGYVATELEKGLKEGKKLSVATVLAPLVQIFRQSVNNVFLPSMSRLQSEGDFKAMLKLNSRANDVAQAGSVAELIRHRDYFMGGHLRFTDFSFLPEPPFASML